MFVACSLLIAGTMLCHYFSLLEILTLENIYKFKVALFTHKITYNATNVPKIFKGTFTLTSEGHSYFTRIVFILNFHGPGINKNYAAVTFAFAGPKIWEKILSKLKKKRKKLMYNSLKAIQTVSFK